MCDCKPGTFENGWHEQRSEACLAKERDAFARAIEACRGFVPAHTNGSTT